MALFINDETKRQLEALQKSTPHAVILSGREGVGLAAVANEYFAINKSTTETILPEKNEVVDLEKGVISIASIRRLYDSTRTVSPEGRVIIVDYAERMAIPAQNAFLKLLEEPSPGTQFILLTHQPETLLPTITSRSQQISVRPVSVAASNELLDNLKVADPTKRAQLLFIASGLPAELTRLATDDDAFSARVELVKDARTFASGTPYDRLMLAKKYKDSRANALILVQDSLNILRKTLADKGDSSTLRAILVLEKLHTRLSEQGNVRLQLSAASML